MEEKREVAEANQEEEKPAWKRYWKLQLATVFLLSSILLSGRMMALAVEYGVPQAVALIVMVVFPANACWGTFTRRMRNWTIAGAACAILAMPIFGLPALVLVILSRNDFRPRNKGSWI